MTTTIKSGNRFTTDMLKAFFWKPAANTPLQKKTDLSLGDFKDEVLEIIKHGDHEQFKKQVPEMIDNTKMSLGLVHLLCGQCGVPSTMSQVNPAHYTKDSLKTLVAKITPEGFQQMQAQYQPQEQNMDSTVTLG